MARGAVSILKGADMARKIYEIEVINWVGNAARTKGDKFYYLDHEQHRIKRFTTIKAARAWIESNGFVPVFKHAKRPTMYQSRPDRYGMSGLQLTIKEAGGRGWIDSSTEGRARDAAIRAAF